MLHTILTVVCVCVCVCVHHGLGLCVPVESVEHLYGNEDGEGHGHGVEIIKYSTTTKRGELRTVNGALKMVGLCVWGGTVGLIQHMTGITETYM